MWESDLVWVSTGARLLGLRFVASLLEAEVLVLGEWYDSGVIVEVELVIVVSS